MIFNNYQDFTDKYVKLFYDSYSNIELSHYLLYFYNDTLCKYFQKHNITVTDLRFRKTNKNICMCVQINISKINLKNQRMFRAQFKQYINSHLCLNIKFAEIEKLPKDYFKLYFTVKHKSNDIEFQRKFFSNFYSKFNGQGPYKKENNYD